MGLLRSAVCDAIWLECAQQTVGYHGTGGIAFVQPLKSNIMIGNFLSVTSHDDSEMFFFPVFEAELKTTY